MRSLLISFVIAALIIGACSPFVLQTHKSLLVLNHAMIALAILTTISAVALLIPKRPDGRQAFALGALCPVGILVFGNVEISNLLARINYSVFSAIVGIGTDQVTALIGGTSVIALANGLLTLVCFGALIQPPAPEIKSTAEPSDAPQPRNEAY